MDITITVPSHVSAEFADEQELITLASNYLFEQAKVRVTSRAGEQAAQVYKDALVDFDDPIVVPATKTLAERVTTAESEVEELRTQMRTVGVALATAAGLKQEEAFSTIDTALGKPVAEVIVEEPLEEVIDPVKDVVEAPAEPVVEPEGAPVV